MAADRRKEISRMENQSESRNGQKRKRRFGDRRDGYRVHAPGLQSIMGYLFPKRTDCEVYLNTQIDATKLMKYLEGKNASHPEYKTTIFHCAVVAMARMVRERPVLNRFIQGWRLYERDRVTISFVAKRRFRDGAEESLMVFEPADGDTIDTVSKKIYGDVTEMRKSEHSTGGIDKTLDNFNKIPHLILAFVIRIIRYLDFWGINPKVLTEGDPNYTTILASNLGSIGGPAVYHHLNNYGTNSIMVTVGTLKDVPVLQLDGSVEVRKMIDIGATLDERIGDGFYFVRSLNLLRYIFDNPELLDRPLGEPSGFDYNERID